MRKFSHLDLINNAVVSGAGDVINRIFESRYVTLYITIPKYDYLRGKVLVSDLNELLEEENTRISLNELFSILFDDLLKQMAFGDLLGSKQGSFDLKTMADFFMKKKDQIFVSDSHTEQEWVSETPFLLKPVDKIISKKHDVIEFPLRMLKKSALRGEVVLYDMAEVYPGFNLTLEEAISVHYCHVMKSVKQGDHNILRRIILNL